MDALSHYVGNLVGMAHAKTKEGRTKWASLGGDWLRFMHLGWFPEATFSRGSKVTSTNIFHEDEEGARDLIWRTAELKKTGHYNPLIWIPHTDSLVRA